MKKLDATEIYKTIKKGTLKYKEEIHCPMIIEVMSTEGTAVAFMRKAMISEKTFHTWVQTHKVFGQCYAYGKIISRHNWDSEGERGKNDEYFNFDLWRQTGAMRYGIGRNRVRFGIDSKSSPYEQYKQLVDQAGEEEFSASEIKQLMESINVGIRAYESFELQAQVNDMKDSINKMDARNANNIDSIEKAAKTD